METQASIISQLAAFEAWRQETSGKILELKAFFKEFGGFSSKVLKRFDQLSQSVKETELRVAFVGEFSRGKTELINSLFFSGYGNRLMPSSAGQTTMCPVELQRIHGDQGDGRPTIMTLPIRSRLNDTSIRELKSTPEAWESHSFDPEDKESRTSAMAHLTETICVPLDEARAMGLCPPAPAWEHEEWQNFVCPPCGLGRVLIPKWRHAIIRVNHPVLEAGLTVIDTPGLNAIGAEPELTLGLLREAHAIIFVLGADTGVTQSDMEIWRSYLEQNSQQTQLIVLNKVDMLWDDLKSEDEIADEIALQIRKTAQRLKVDSQRVMAISAQKALIGRVKQQNDLITRSKIMELERAMARLLIPIKKQQLAQEILGAAHIYTDDKINILSKHKQSLENQIQELTELRTQTEQKIPKLLEKHRKNKEQFESDLVKFKEQQQDFQQKAESQLLKHLVIEDFDAIIDVAKSQILSAWTTVGIRDQLKSFFGETLKHFDNAHEGAQVVSNFIYGCYRDLENRHRLPPLKALPDAVDPRRQELKRIAERYNSMGKSFEIMVNTQNTVVKKTFLVITQQIRDFVAESRQAVLNWIEEVHDLSNQQIQIQMGNVNRELATLEEIEGSLGQLENRIADLRSETQEIARKLEKLSASTLPLKKLFGQE